MFLGELTTMHIFQHNRINRNKIDYDIFIEQGLRKTKNSSSPQELFILKPFKSDHVDRVVYDPFP